MTPAFAAHLARALNAAEKAIAARLADDKSLKRQLLKKRRDGPQVRGLLCGRQ